MGRPRKSLSASTKHRTVAEQEQKKQEELLSKTPDDLLNTPPTSELRDKLARDTWERIIPDLVEYTSVGNLDRDDIIAYCNSWSRVVEAEKKYKNRNLSPEEKDKWEARLYKATADHRKYASLCGMTLDSRLKAATVKIKQKDKEIADEFGDI